MLESDIIVLSSSCFPQHLIWALIEMGCPNSKLGSDDDEPVKICKDKKRFIKQAVDHRTSFASAHIAYIQSLRNVSDALRA